MSFTPLLQLKKFPDIPVSTREEARESRPHSEESRFHLLSREEGSFPCVLGKEFPAFPSHLKSRCSQQERREELQGRATIPSVPQMSQSIPGKPVSLHCLDFQAEVDSHHGGTWDSPVESLVGNPRGKASSESHRSFDPHDRNMTLPLLLWRKAHVHATTRDKD